MEIGGFISYSYSFVCRLVDRMPRMTGWRQLTLTSAVSLARKRDLIDLRTTTGRSLTRYTGLAMLIRFS